MSAPVIKTPFELPEYREAIARETLVREASFLPITETVAGFELVPMTFQQFLILKTTRNPLLDGGMPSPTQLIAFLWLLSPTHSPNQKDRLAFGRRCNKFIPPPKPLIHFPWLMMLWRWRTARCLKRVAEMVKAISTYMDETLMDWPASNRQGQSVNYYGDGAAICSLFAREYNGWTPQAVLALPMKQLLQFLREIRLRTEGVAAVSNPSDRVVAEYLREVNRKN